MGKIIGIDLGTTNSVIAVMKEGNPTIIPNSEGEKVTPSVVAFDLNTRQLMVGTPAKRQAVTNPHNTIFSIKRFVGQRFADSTIQHDVKLAPYKIRAANDGSISIRMGERWYSPSEILAMILVKLKRDAEVYLKESVTQAVVTVPAYFNNSQRQATEDACNIAGLKVWRIINEPTAASLAYGMHREIDKTVAIYHLGGGTLDVTIMEMGYSKLEETGQFFEVVSTSGDTHLGGDDFDQRIIDWLCDRFEKEQGVDLRQDRVALQRLKWAAEKAKCELSTALQTEINLPYIIAEGSDHRDLMTTLSRAELEELVSDLVERTLGPCEQALADAELTATTGINEVVLVGQQTRMPFVQKAVKKFFGRDPCWRVDPAEAVALGAAIQAGVIGGEIKDALLLDVTPFTLSIEALGGVVTPLIKRNGSIPTKKSQIFSTAVDNQTSVDIKVYQGERVMAADNVLLGQFRLEGIPPAPRGVPQIEVTFDIDVNGILNVSAKDIGTGRERAVTIIGSHAVDSCVIAIGKANEMIYEVELSLSKQGDRLSIHVRSIVDSKVSALRTAIKGKDVTEIRRKTQELDIVQDCIEALGKSCDEKAVKFLTEFLRKEEEKQIRECIRQALRQIGGSKVDEVLRPRTWLDKLLGRRRWVDR